MFDGEIIRQVFDAMVGSEYEVLGRAAFADERSGPKFVICFIDHANDGTRHGIANRFREAGRAVPSRPVFCSRHLRRPAAGHDRQNRHHDGRRDCLLFERSHWSVLCYRCWMLRTLLLGLGYADGGCVALQSPLA